MLTCEIPRGEGNWWTVNAVFLGAVAALTIIVGFILNAGVMRDGSSPSMEVALTIMPVRPVVPHVVSSPCLTRGCREASAFLRNTLNEDIDPCRNFAKFVCSGAPADYDFLREVDGALLDASAATLDAVLVVPRIHQTATQRATVLFRACVAGPTDNDVEALRALLRQHGLADGERTHPAEAMLRLAARYGNGVLFSLSWYVEPKGVKLPVRIERNEDLAVWMDSSNQRSAAMRTDCVDTVMSVVYGYDSQDDLRSLREVVLEAEETLQVLWSNATSSPTRTGLIGDIGASRLLVSALNEAAEGQVAFTPSDALQVSDVQATLDLMQSAVGSLDARHLLLYLGFELVRQMGPLLRLEHLSCFGQPLALGSRRSCARLVRELAGPAAHASYLRRQLLDAPAARRASATFRAVKRELQRRIRGARWMPIRARKAVLSGLNATGAMIAFPAVLQSEPSLDEYYAAVPDMDGVLFKDILSWRRTRIAQLLQSRDSVSYDSGKKLLLVPTFLALPPLFSRDGPAALHYGFLGLHIANSLAAVALTLESEAVRTAIGRNCDALSGQDLSALFAASVVSDAYGKAADSSGVATFSGPQTLFVAACAAHCSGDATCNTALSHLPAFARAFHCARGTPMRPSRQCLLPSQ